MRRLKNEVAVCVDERSFASGEIAPKHKDNPVAAFADSADYCIRKLLPTYAAV